MFSTFLILFIECDTKKRLIFVLKNSCKYMWSNLLIFPLIFWTLFLGTQAVGPFSNPTGKVLNLYFHPIFCPHSLWSSKYNFKHFQYHVADSKMKFSNNLMHHLHTIYDTSLTEKVICEVSSKCTSSILHLYPRSWKANSSMV